MGGQVDRGARVQLPRRVARLGEIDRILAVASGQGLGVADGGGEAAAAAADHVIAKLKTPLA